MDLGKEWEAKFRKSWKAAFPKKLIFRLHDQMNGYKEVSGNPCDFFTFTAGAFFMVECKEHKGASIPFDVIPQYDRLLKYKDYDDVYPGVLVWFSEKDLVYWVSIHEMERMVQDGEKSIGIRMVKQGKYTLVPIPCEKKDKYMYPDCIKMVELIKEERTHYE